MLPAGRHFAAAEFACHDGTPYPEAWLDRWQALVDLCDAIRDLWGGPLIVVSGFRTLAHNLELIEADAGKGTHGVASGSMHLEGHAADLRTLRGAVDVPHLHRVALMAHQMKKLPALGGLAAYPVSGWIHVDTFKATDGHLRQWSGR